MFIISNSTFINVLTVLIIYYWLSVTFGIKCGIINIKYDTNNNK